jgi:hypothetical protein
VSKATAAADDVIHVRRERFIMQTPGKTGGTMLILGMIAAVGFGEKKAMDSMQTQHGYG